MYVAVVDVDLVEEGGFAACGHRRHRSLEPLEGMFDGFKVKREHVEHGNWAWPIKSQSII